MMGALNLEDMRRRLEDRKSDLVRMKHESEHSRQVVELDQTSVGRVSRINAIQGQAMALATDRQREAELNRIAAALQRLDDGIYGACLSCSDDIAFRRLEADPSAPLCIGCASKNK
jgi:DnaK suppressor protein